MVAGAIRLRPHGACEPHGEDGSCRKRHFFGQTNWLICWEKRSSLSFPLPVCWNSRSRCRPTEIEIMKRTLPDADARIPPSIFRGKSDRILMTVPLEGAEGAMGVVVYGNQEKAWMEWMMAIKRRATRPRRKLKSALEIARAEPGANRTGRRATRRLVLDAGGSKRNQ